MVLRRTFSLTLLAMATAAIAASAHAQDKPEVLTKERQLEICIASFEEGQMKQKRGKVVFARKLFIDCSAEVCPRQLREDCARHKDEIDRAVPTVVLVVRDAAGKDVNASIKVDGQPFVSEPGRATPIDPGPHEVEIKIADRSTAKSKITVYEGEKSRVIVLSESGGLASSSPSPAAPTGSDSGAHAPRPLPIGPMIVGSVGVLALVAGTGFLILSGSEAKERDDQRALAASITDQGSGAEAERRAYNASADSHDNASSNNQLLGIVALTAGVLLVGGAVGWYFLGQPSKQSAAPALRIAPMVSPTMAGAMYTAAFF